MLQTLVLYKPTSGNHLKINAFILPHLSSLSFFPSPSPSLPISLEINWDRNIESERISLNEIWWRPITHQHKRVALFSKILDIHLTAKNKEAWKLSTLEFLTEWGHWSCWTQVQVHVPDAHWSRQKQTEMLEFGAKVYCRAKQRGSAALLRRPKLPEWFSGKTF